MQKAQSSDELLFSLKELRPKDAIRSFRRSIIEDYPTKGCCYCGVQATSWTLDHIIPRKNNGPTKRWNLAKCCTKCNGAKGSQQVLYFWRPKVFWAKHREETMFDWIRENSSMSSILTLEESLRQGNLNNQALEELKDEPQPTTTDFWEAYCLENPSLTECLIYDV
jgi:hypothetical protein